jgi:hypothetical protein
MGTQEYAGGPIILVILYVLFMMLKEDGLVATLGIIGKFLWWLIKMYLIFVPVIIVLWLLSQVGFTKDFPTLSWIISCLVGGGAYIWFMERGEKRKHKGES